MTPESISARHFEIFLAMTVSRGLNEAADRLGISVAGVSKSLKALERETGLTLFRTVKGRLVATSEAERLVPYAQRAVDHLNRARRAARELKGEDGETVTLGVAGPALLALVPDALARVRSAFPRLRIALTQDRTQGIIERVAAGEVDLGIGTPPVQDIDARALALCHVQDICDAPLCAALPEGHPLTARSHLRPADLAGEPLISLGESSATTRLVAVMFQQAGQALDPIAVVDNAIGVGALVQQGLGIGLINPLMLAHGAFPGVVLRPFRPRVVLRTCAYTAKGRTLSPVLDGLKAALSEAALSLRPRLPG